MRDIDSDVNLSDCIKVRLKQQRIEALKRIITDKQFEMIEGVLVDMQTAHAIISVYEALNPENQEKFMSYSMETMGHKAWKVIAAARAKR